MKAPEDLPAGRAALLSTLTTPFLGAADISDKFGDVLAAGDKLRMPAVLPVLRPGADVVLGLMERQRQLYCPAPAGSVDMFLWDVQVRTLGRPAYTDSYHEV
jgi:hypothetical protein